MKLLKTGTSMSMIINTRRKKDKEYFQRRYIENKKRAKICLECESNKEGFCKKHTEWCNMVNWICLGIDNPYRFTTSKPKKKHEKTRKINDREVRS